MKSNYRFLILLFLSGLLAVSTQAQERVLGRRDAGASRGSTSEGTRDSRGQSPSPSNQGQVQSRPQVTERTRPVFTDRGQNQPQATERTRPVFTDRGQEQTQQAPRTVPTQESSNRVSPGTASSDRGAVDRTNRWNNRTQDPRASSTQQNRNRGISRNGSYPGNNNNVSTSRGDRGGYSNGYNNYQGNNYYNRGYYNTRPTVVYNAYNPSWRYNYYPRRNTIVSVFPFSYSTINFGGYDYRYYDGLYYQPYNNAFRVVAPPIGIYINILPIGYRRIMVRDYPYYYYNGTYYNDYNNSYRVVAPPVGATVESIPDGYETIVIDGQTYYKVDDVQYKPVVQDNGEIWYEVIKVG